MSESGNKCLLCSLGDKANLWTWRVACNGASPPHSVYACDDHYPPIVGAAGPNAALFPRTVND